MTAKIYWLFAGSVITAHRSNGTTHEKKMNVLVTTDEITITRADLARAQDGMQRRFATECPQLPGFKIVDCYISGFSLMGQMTPEEFNAGFEKEVAASGGMN